MQAKTKTTDEIEGHRYLLRKLPTEVGSFILMRMLGIQMRVAAANAEEQMAKEASKPAELSVQQEERPKPSGEDMVRAIVFSLFSGGVMSFEDFKFIQQSCMKVTSIIKEREGHDFPMPVMDDHGRWSTDGAVLADESSLVVRLTTEVLILCFADFFGGSSTGLKG